ncbi:het domain-containing protein [Colletotrichum plurivorum]|uniref:Het domain-containing protein n=1 Tax=Colletotrichum plurivorum TaxID=2175906 RepID=A0A8H6NNA1_9PEZI|nr:het domain-containing protein [Colletotrichum plurivorum]
MFRWYQGAAVCYAYLGRCPARPDFRNSRWFTRGWTLQELLAPKHVDFYNRAWSHIGDRSSMAEVIKNVTRIPVQYLRNEQGFRSASIAVRMSWAASRQTKRIEDRAYSLLGIFGVNMPLLYGEGDRAFERLQLALIDETTDESILAWSPSRNSLESTSSVDSTCFSISWANQYELPLSQWPSGQSVLLEKTTDDSILAWSSSRNSLKFTLPVDSTSFSVSWANQHKPPLSQWPSGKPGADLSQSYENSSSHGLLARVPEDFACWKDAVVTPLYEANSVMEMNNRGLRITLPLVGLENHTYGLLRCKVGRDFSQSLLLPLSQTSVADEYVRSQRPFLLKCSHDFSKRISKHIIVHTIYIRKDFYKEPSVEYPIWNAGLKCGCVRLQESAGLPERLVEVIPSQAYNRPLHVLYPLGDGHNNWERAFLHYAADNGEPGFVIILEKRSHMDAFLSPNKISPPFKCHIVPKSNQSFSVQAKELKKVVGFQPLRNRLFVGRGARVAEVKHDTFLDHEMFTIDVSKEVSDSILLFSGSDWDGLVRPSTADVIFFCGRYVLDSLLTSWQEFFYVPLSIISWRYSFLLDLGESLAWGAVVFLFFMVRLKAYWAACSVHVSDLAFRKTEIVGRLKYLDRPFIYFHMFMNILIYYRGVRCGRRGFATLATQVCPAIVHRLFGSKMFEPIFDLSQLGWTRTALILVMTAILFKPASFLSALISLGQLALAWA